MNKIHIMNIVQCAILVNSFLINFAVYDAGYRPFPGSSPRVKTAMFEFYGEPINYLDDMRYSSNKTLSNTCIRYGLSDSNGYMDGEVQADDEKGF